MNNICLKIAVAMIAGIGLFSSQAGAVTRDVNCDKGQTIQAALDKGQGSAEQLVIDVSGECEEDLIIRRDDVFINGNNNASIKGNIQVFGGRRIELHNITLTGPGLGIDNFGGDVDLRNVIVTGNQGVAGVASNQNGFVAIYDSIISNNAGIGVLVLLGSTVEMHNTDILDNTGDGVDVNRNSNADIRDGCEISGNANGVFLWLHASAYIIDTEITANDSYGILMDNDSGVVTGINVNISSNVDSGVFCYDTESSFESASAITDAIECTDYNQVLPAQ